MALHCQIREIGFAANTQLQLRVDSFEQRTHISLVLPPCVKHKMIILFRLL